MKKSQEIIKMYEDSFHLHGDSHAALLTPKGRNSLRFSVLRPYLNDQTTLLDFGCGLGYLYEYLTNDLGRGVKYTGYDLVPEFVAKSTEKFPKADFRLIEPEEKLEGQFDIVFASGVFNLAFDDNKSVAKKYALSRLIDLFQVSSDLFVCDFLSEFVDFQQEGALHFSPGEIADFCFQNFGRRFIIRHDILPYEFTLIVWKNQTITRPQNIYQYAS